VPLAHALTRSVPGLHIRLRLTPSDPVRMEKAEKPAARAAVGRAAAASAMPEYRRHPVGKLSHSLNS
jgi:hypothetical protein